MADKRRVWVWAWRWGTYTWTICWRWGWTQRLCGKPGSESSCWYWSSSFPSAGEATDELLKWWTDIFALRYPKDSSSSVPGCWAVGGDMTPLLHLQPNSLLFMVPSSHGCCCLDQVVGCLLVLGQNISGSHVEHQDHVISTHSLPAARDVISVEDEPHIW